MDDNVKSWIKKAEEDALAAKVLLNSEFLLAATVCFHCQQMAEKYIKAYLTSQLIFFRKTHDLVNLLDEYLLDIDEKAEELRDACIYLTDFGVLPRYPGDYPDLTNDDANKAWYFTNQIKDFIILKINE